MINTDSLIKKLYDYSAILKQQKNFPQTINHHYKLMIDMCSAHPLFYKMILKDTRLNIALALLCFYYSKKKPSLADIKQWCNNHDLGSPNSVDSLLVFLRVSNRINVEKCEQDRRTFLYTVTEKGKGEARHYLFNGLSAIAELYPAYNIEVNQLEDEEKMRAFFLRRSDLVFNKLFISNILPDARIFLNKDAGNLAFILLYNAAREGQETGQKLLNFSYSQMAKESFISRTHLRRMVNAAAEKGLITIHGSATIEIHPEFVSLAEEYMGLYFASLFYCLEIEPTR